MAWVLLFDGNRAHLRAEFEDWLETAPSLRDTFCLCVAKKKPALIDPVWPQSCKQIIHEAFCGS
jgi:hypothetical protein